MRTETVTLEALADLDNLALATWKAARGKRRRADVVDFLARLDHNLTSLAADILGERAPTGQDRQFQICDPKPRVITAPCFRDRVLHHAILNLAEERLERGLVESSFACRPGKGVHAAMRRVQSHLRRDRAWPWVVRVDVKSYFSSIDHSILSRLLRQRFRGRGFLDLLERILSSGAGSTRGRGLPIGSLTSQHFANLYLDGGDRYLLAHHGVRAHVRYMDDIVWWCPTRLDAVQSLADFGAFLRTERGLTLKERVHVGLSRAGLFYCGSRVRQGVILPSSRRMTRYRGQRRRIEAVAQSSTASEWAIQACSDQLVGSLNGTTSRRFRASVEREVLE